MTVGAIALSSDDNQELSLESIESRLEFCEKLCKRILIQQSERNCEPVKSYHWVTVAVVLIVAYLVGVKYPSIGQSALSKIGLS